MTMSPPATTMMSPHSTMIGPRSKTIAANTSPPPITTSPFTHPMTSSPPPPIKISPPMTISPPSNLPLIADDCCIIICYCALSFSLQLVSNIFSLFTDTSKFCH